MIILYFQNKDWKKGKKCLPSYYSPDLNTYRGKHKCLMNFVKGLLGYECTEILLFMKKLLMAFKIIYINIHVCPSFCWCRAASYNITSYGYFLVNLYSNISISLRNNLNKMFNFMQLALTRNGFNIIRTNQKTWLFQKFKGCGSKISPAAPVSILNF